MKEIKIGIFGASGYSGWELFKILTRHPNVDVVFSTSESFTGQKISDIWPSGNNTILQSAESVDLSSVDCVFLCLPHTKSAKYAAKTNEQDTAVIDLSADLRLNDPVGFEKWYQAEHTAPDLLPVVYGLPEQYRDEIRGQKIIANPGCYPTAMLLGLLPLAKNSYLIEGTPIIVDAKSGTTGAGRKAKKNLLFSEVHGNFFPYKIGRVHQHIGEVEQQLKKAGVSPGNMVFSPHLLPVDRGILAAIYVQVKDSSQAEEAIRSAYIYEPLVNVLPKGNLPSLAHVVRTPFAYLSITPVADQFLIINVAIDNLLKGAASQAVQNFNLMYGFEETTALFTDDMVANEKN